MLKKTTLILTSTLFFTSVHADPFYVQANLNRTNIDIEVVDETDTTFGIDVGYYFNKNLAIEAGYIDFGELSINGNGSFSVEADAVQLSVKGIYPVSNTIGFYAEAGIDFWDGKVSFSNVPGFGSGSDNENGNDLFYGIGGVLAFNDNISAHLEYMLHDLDDLEIDTLTLGIQANF